jgi:hypothetical protein
MAPVCTGGTQHRQPKSAEQQPPTARTIELITPVITRRIAAKEVKEAPLETLAPLLARVRARARACARVSA